MRAIVQKSLICVGVLLSWAAAVRAADESHNALTIEVDAGAFDRINTPVTILLPEAQAQTQHFTLTRREDGAQVPVQRLSSDTGPVCLWLIQEPLKARQKRTYRLEPTDVAETNQVVCRDDGQRLLVQVAGRPVLRYNHAVVESRSGLDPVYRRSGYIHPVFDPLGREVTGDFPPDHAHQHALFFAWVNTSFQEQSVDFWNQAKQTGVIAHGQTDYILSGPVCAEFLVRLNHSARSPAGKTTGVLNESWRVRVFNVSDSFLFEIESRQTCATRTPLMINEYHYGGMALRGCGQWYDAAIAGQIRQLRKSGAGPAQLAQVPVKRDYLTSEGKTWVDGNATRARWVDMSGLIDGSPSGIAVLGHPDNFRAPQPVRLHPDKPYFCFAPMILGSFQIEPGDGFVSRYRYYVHAGKTEANAIERVWNDYAHPPSARFVSDRN